MAALAPHRFTVKDYYRMAETGVLAPDARVELLDGEIIDLEPIGPFHGGVTKRLNHLFTPKAKGRWVTSVQDPLRLDEHSQPEPDLMLLRPAEDGYADHHPAAEDVFLLIEVAQRSLEYDRSRKLPAYGKAGVPEVWIINLEDAVVEVYREPHYLGYGSRLCLGAGGEVSPAAFPDLKIDITELLRRGH